MLINEFGSDVYKNYYYKADGNLKSIGLNYYEFIDGEWQLLSDEIKLDVSGQEGNIFIFDNCLSEGVALALQNDEDGIVKTSYKNENGWDTFEMGISSWHSNTPNAGRIHYGEETLVRLEGDSLDENEKLPSIELKNFEDTEVLSAWDRVFAVALVFYD
ncbi:MAG: hypothetical protein PUD43_04825 [Clostridia bacterium]|nr:hypothetical protein [Clostridia bacterium]